MLKYNNSKFDMILAHQGEFMNFNFCASIFVKLTEA
jgi:hypothetical protein